MTQILNEPSKKKQKQKKCKVLENKNAETDKQLEEKNYQHQLKLEQALIMESLIGKRGRFLKNIT